MMLNRREFIKSSLSAGLALGAGSLLSSCSGVRRGELFELNEAENRGIQLDGTARTILYQASLAPSGHNSQPWRVRVENPDFWTVEVDESRRLPAVDPDSREVLLSIGAFVENLSITAGALGLIAEINVIANDRNDRAAVRIAFHKDQPSGYPIQRMERRRTVKHGHLPKQIKSEDVKALSEPLGGRLFYFPRGTKHASCIRDAAVESYRIQAQRDEAQTELVRWLRLSDPDARLYRDGLSAEGMEIQGLKGWFVRHWVKPEAFLKESHRQQGIDLMADLAGQGAGWFILTSPGQTAADLIETGRRFERMALLACERGIGIHPMTQILEEKQGIEQLAAHHGNALFPQFVLRVGYLETYPEPVSLRRPVDWFVTA